MAGDPLLSTLHRGLRAINIDILGPLRRVCEDHGPVAKDLQEATGDGQFLRFAPGPDLKEPRPQLRQQRRMVWEYRQLPFPARRNEYVHIAGEEFFLCRNYF